MMRTQSLQGRSLESWQQRTIASLSNRALKQGKKTNLGIFCYCNLSKFNLRRKYIYFFFDFVTMKLDI